MHKRHIDGLIQHKLKQLKLILTPNNWDRMSDEISTKLEYIIENKLANHTTSLKEEDWEHFAQLLDDAFDKEIRDILSQYKVSLLPEDWSLLASQLDGHDLDQALLNGLQGFELPFQESDWELMAGKLDDTQMDTQIREGLAQLELTPNPEDWEAFESKIADHFDDQIKDKLDGLEIKPGQEDWAAFTTLMDGDALFTHVRESLDGLNEEGSHQDWQAMEDKLNQPFYTAFQEKFAFHSIAPLKGDWKAMEAKLKEEEGDRVIILPWYAQARVYLTAASVLLLFMVLPFWVGKDKFQTTPSNEFASKRTEGALQNKEVASPASTTPGESATVPGSLKPLKSPDNSAASIDLSSVFAEVDPFLKAIQTTDPQNYQNPTRISAQPAVEFSVNPELVDGVLVPAENPTLIEKSKKGKNTQAKLDLSGAPTREGFLHSMSFRAFADPLSMNMDSHKKGITQVPVFTKRRPPFRLGLLVGSSHTVPELSPSKSLSKRKFGDTYRTGLRTEFQVKSNWHFVTGLVFEKRHFGHSFIDFGDNDDREFLESIGNPSEDEVMRTEHNISANIKMLEVPLLMRVYLPSEGALSMYFQGGIVPMISLQEDYKSWEDTNFPNIQPFPGEAEAPDQTQKWSLNTYAGNINLSAGLELRFTNQFAFQFEPYALLSLQETKGSGSLDFKEKMYTGGLSFSLVYGFSGK